MSCGASRKFAAIAMAADRVGRGRRYAWSRLRVAAAAAARRVAVALAESFETIANVLKRKFRNYKKVCKSKRFGV